MKRLLLTSSGIFVTDGDYQIFDQPREKLRWAYITTAQKGVEDRSYIQRRKKRMKALKWNYQEIDIDGKNKQELRKLLRDKDVVYLEGGNSFYLLKSIRQSGFDQLIKELINQGIVYVGSSAGSYVACPTIEMATWKRQIRPNYGVRNLRAMNLVPFLIVAHYHPQDKKFLQPYISQAKYPVKALTDQQAILVKGSKIQLVGKGKAVKLK